MTAVSSITTSIFELFKAGPGPSSSHTIAPMAAGLDFRKELSSLPDGVLREAKSLAVRLFGSLSATGFGHGTHKAVITGLLGFEPAACPGTLPSGVFDLPEEERTISAGPFRFTPGPESVINDSIEHLYPYSNTLVCELRGADGAVLHAKTYYSVGGGFLQWEGWTPPERGAVPYPYASGVELQRLANENGISIPHLVLRNEMALTGAKPADIYGRLDGIVDIMRRSVSRGSSVTGMLPGSLGVYRKAAHLAGRADMQDDPLNRFLGLLNAYAFAVAEENAAGGIIVTAPTCGAAGVLPAVLTMLEGYFGLGPEAVHSGMLAAAAVGFLAKHNAGIAGAEVGCQGEVGVASAMAAAMLAQAKGFSPRIILNAAEIALEHHLGLTCDPVGGYVQIPCIERNAMGALKAYNAFLVASMEDVERHRVTLDVTLRAMAETGRDMNAKYKETSLGGLAVSLPEC
ncbi:L-serine dehydratase [uncultured delta proteobacterium]|uniref:L-serine dehydratase n=1 Tax=uncultured delta proteobacterium TaxID=34034 RepID=A0A212JE46_9DELT|nr:L-serine dehydratase [uncultured delta proteobacterium]